MSASVRPHRWQATRLPCPWDSPGRNTGVGCHFLLHTSLQLPSNIFKTFSTDHLPDPKSKSTLIPWATEVIIVNPLNECMENLLRWIFTQQDITWSFSFLCFTYQSYMSYIGTSHLLYIYWKVLVFLFLSKRVPWNAP